MQGPTDPQIRPQWEEARRLFALFDPTNLKKATEMLEDALRAVPDDPWLMASLALCNVRTFIQHASSDRTLFIRAEELALRAIDIDPSVADAYHAVALVRNTMGDYRGVFHAEEEALRRNPLMSEAHFTIASALADVGHLPLALQRIELSLRLDPNSFGAQTTRARILATMGRLDEARRAIAQAYAAGGGPAIAVFESRLVYWVNDRARAAALADEIEGHSNKAAWAIVIPTLRAFAQGEDYPPFEGAMEAYVKGTFGPRQQGFLAQIAIEHYGALGMRDKALKVLSRIDMGAFWDLAWLDHCAALDCIRDTPQLAEARARTAERVAMLFA